MEAVIRDRKRQARNGAQGEDEERYEIGASDSECLLARQCGTYISLGAKQEEDGRDQVSRC